MVKSFFTDMFSKRQLFLRLMRKLQKKYLQMHCDRDSDSLSTGTTTKKKKQTNKLEYYRC